GFCDVFIIVLYIFCLLSNGDVMPFLFPYCVHHLDLPSFPTRRSSDLVIQDREDVATSPIAKNGSVGENVQRSLIGAGPLDPRLDSRIIKRQNCRIMDQHTTMIAIETKRLPDKPRRESRVALQRAIVCP